MPIELECTEDKNRIPAVLRVLPGAIREGLDELEDETLARIDRGFARGVDAMGNPWQPLSEKTIRLKGHDKILIEEGDLRNSFESSIEPLNYTLEISNDDHTAAIHEFGAMDQNIPARPFMRPAMRWIESQGIETEFADELDSRVGKVVL